MNQEYGFDEHSLILEWYDSLDEVEKEVALARAWLAMLGRMDEGVK